MSTSIVGITYSITFFSDVTLFTQNNSPFKDTSGKFQTISQFVSSTPPDATGFTYYLGFSHSRSSNDPLTLYQSTVKSGWYVCINHQFYLRAANSGKHCVTLPGFQDNYTGVWVGDKAIQDYSRENLDLLKNMADASGTMPASFSFELSKGQIVPIRIININGTGPGLFSATVTGPDGKGGVRLLCDQEAGKSIVDIFRNFEALPPDSKDNNNNPVRPFAAFPSRTTS